MCGTATTSSPPCKRADTSCIHITEALSVLICHVSSHPFIHTPVHTTMKTMTALMLVAAAASAVAGGVRAPMKGAAGAAGAPAGAPAGGTCVKMTVTGAAGVGGTILAQLEANVAQTTVKNFLDYVDNQYYASTIFHRCIKNFMIQGGGFQPQFYHDDFSEKPGQRGPIKNEAELLNKRGTLSMARTNDPDSATSQFFINTVDNTSLDKTEGSAGYAVFGKVLSGMDIVDTIQNQPTTTIGSYADVPTTPIVIKDIARAPCA